MVPGGVAGKRTMCRTARLACLVGREPVGGIAVHVFLCARASEASRFVAPLAVRFEWVQYKELLVCVERFRGLKRYVGRATGVGVW